MTATQTPATAAPEAGAVQVEQFGDWTIWYQPWPIECRDYDWHFAHRNVRVAEELSGHAESREMCLQQIDWLDECERERETEKGKASMQAFVDSGMRTLNRALLADALKHILDLPGIRNLPGFATGVHLQAADYALAQYEEQTRG